MSDVFEVNVDELQIGDIVTKAEMFVKLLDKHPNGVIKCIKNGYDYQIVSIEQGGE